MTYFGEFACVDDVVDAFSGEGITPNAIRADLSGAEILFAGYDNNAEEYCGSARVVYRAAGDLYLVEGSHCSCMGLEGQWAPRRVVPSVLARSTCPVPDARNAWDNLMCQLGGDL